MKYDDVLKKENNCFENTNVIVYKKKKRLRFNKTLLLAIMCFVTLFSLQFINTNFTNNLLKTFNSITQVGKPTAELFDEEGNVFFVSFFNTISLGNKLPKEFDIPVIFKQIECNGNVVKMTSASNVVKVGYDGQVKKITLENEKKIVYIEHAGGLVSRYENLEYVGVISGQIVKRGSTIGSITEGKELILSFTIKNNAAKIEVENEKIRFVI